jgi:predicted 3-demethylubiquinone-9 3-methyltransferase (glyoxalase superfamily)
MFGRPDTKRRRVTKGEIAMSSIAPCLWFNGNAEEAANFYVSLFPNSSIDVISRYGEGAPFPAGTPLLISFTLSGRPFQALNGGPHFTFSEAVSFSIDCADQAEVDRYWDALTADGGEPSMCGWLKDRFGVSWQVVPRTILTMQQNGTAEQVARMMDALLKMRKLDVATLEAVFKG